MRQLSGLLLGLAMLMLLHANAHGQAKKEEAKSKSVAPAPSLKHLDGCKIVFVVNGAGDSAITSENLSAVNGEQKLGLVIKPITWCRQHTALQDLTDQDAQLSAAAKIADWTKAIRKDAPKAEIYYVGHSAGARIVLSAAEMVGEKGVDRVILLHAAVSQSYDLKPALKGARLGIDSFYATDDYVLDHVRESVGFADGGHGHAAGRLGFVATNAKDEAYRNFRQYRWTENYHGSGGHFAWVIQHNMKRVLPPLFFSN